MLSSMKTFFPMTLFASLPFVLLLASCESTDSRKAGGGAFDDSHLGPKLDANAAVDDSSSPSSGSFEQWRNQD